jgi:hypothetical protein
MYKTARYVSTSIRIRIRICINPRIFSTNWMYRKGLRSHLLKDADDTAYAKLPRGVYVRRLESLDVIILGFVILEKLWKLRSSNILCAVGLRGRDATHQLPNMSPDSAASDLGWGRTQEMLTQVCFRDSSINRGCIIIPTIWSALVI